MAAAEVDRDKMQHGEHDAARPYIGPTRHSHCMRVVGSLGRFSPLGRLQLLWPCTLDA